MQLKMLFILTSLVVSSFAQTTAVQVESDITNSISPRLSTVVAAVDAFPISGGTLGQAMAIDTADTNLNDAIVATTVDINNANCPFSDTDALAILKQLDALSPDIQQSLTDIVARKPGFDAIGATPLIKQDLTTLKASSDAMGAALTGCVSSTVAPAAEEFQSAVDAAFSPAIAAFD